MFRDGISEIHASSLHCNTKLAEDLG